MLSALYTKTLINKVLDHFYIQTLTKSRCACYQCHSFSLDYWGCTRLPASATCCTQDSTGIMSATSQVTSCPCPALCRGVEAAALATCSCLPPAPLVPNPLPCCHAWTCTPTPTSLPWILLFFLVCDGVSHSIMSLTTHYGEWDRCLVGSLLFLLHPGLCLMHRKKNIERIRQSMCQ